MSLFIDPDLRALEAAKDLGVPAIELHTGRYAHSWRSSDAALKQLREAARYASDMGLAVHAGHGLTYLNVEPVAGDCRNRGAEHRSQRGEPSHNGRDEERRAGDAPRHETAALNYGLEQASANLAGMTNPLGTADFFALEAGECLDRLETLVQSTAPPPADEFLRMARVLRGSALMAAQPHIAKAAAGLEAFARSNRDQQRAWDPGTREHIAQSVEEFRSWSGGSANGPRQILAEPPG